ncbi:hypothetical protein C0J52_21375 [Blattella germanica]|nr:hypothetical protein C0J52_21375 [Blattella germanica]
MRGLSTTLLNDLRPQYHRPLLDNELPEQDDTPVARPQFAEVTMQQSVPVPTRRRLKRQTSYSTRGYGNRYRGQTQSQYLAFQNGGNGGKALAESGAQLSRTHVSGTNGMGQAQSQSGTGGCEDCFPGGAFQTGGTSSQSQQVAFPGYPGVSDGVAGRPGVGIPGQAGAGVPGQLGLGVPGGIPGQPFVGIPGGIPGHPGVGVPGQPGLGVPGGIPGQPGAGIPGGIPGHPGVGVPGQPGLGVPGGIPGQPGIAYPGQSGVGIPVYPGVGTSTRPGVGTSTRPGVIAPGVGYPGIGTSGPPRVSGRPGVGTPGVSYPGTSGVGVPGETGVGYPGYPGRPGVGAPGQTGDGISGQPGGGVGIPGVVVPGHPGTSLPGTGVPGQPGAPGQLGIGVPGGSYPGQPGVGVVGQPGVEYLPGTIPGLPGGVPGQLGVGIPGVGVSDQPGVGYLGGYPGQLGVGVPGQVGTGYPGIGVGVGGGVGIPGVGGPGVGVPGAGGAGVGVSGVPQDIYHPGAYQQPGYYQQGYGYVGGDSQAESSIKKEDNETRAVSSAQGKYGEGTAQTQVSGIYSGSGSFSAQAQTSDKDRGAQSQVIGGSEGATSTAQGQAGGGKSQTQVQLGVATGATTAEAQSGSLYYGTNTQVQAGSQGGMADAQAKGQGSTSSQAQVGFLPYQKNGKGNGQKTPFHGGGTASAQSGAYSGQSQSQIQGSFLHGVSYTGAAQAGSGVAQGGTTNSGYENFGGKLGLVQTGSQNTGSSTSAVQNGQYQQPLSSLNSPSNGGLLSQGSRQQRHDGGGQLTHHIQSTPDQQIDYDDEDDDDDEDDSTDEHGSYLGSDNSSPYGTASNFGATRHANGNSVSQQRLYGSNNYAQNNTGQVKAPTQTQHIILGPLNGQGAHIVQDSDDGAQYSPGDVLQPGQRIHGSSDYTIPQGYRGRITSVSGPGKTSSRGGQAQTVVLTPGSGNVTYTNPSSGRYQPPVMNIPVGRSSSGQSTSPDNSHLRNGDRQTVNRRNGSYNNQRQGGVYRNGDNTRTGQSFSTYNHPTPDSFVTVTKSVTGQLDNGRANNSTGSGGKYTHTYYTKSSTCGYFTFSCNVVFGSNGRTRICKPNPPTNPDGTPCCC